MKQENIQQPDNQNSLNDSKKERKGVYLSFDQLASFYKPGMKKAELRDASGCSVACINAYWKDIKKEEVKPEKTDDKYHLNTVLSFGKHKGLTIEQVLAYDPQYIKWMINVGAWKLCECVYEVLPKPELEVKAKPVVKISIPTPETIIPNSVAYFANKSKFVGKFHYDVWTSMAKLNTKTKYVHNINLSQDQKQTLQNSLN